MALLRPYLAQHAPRDDVEDLLQEVMLRLHQREASEDIHNPTAYAYQTARSVLADRARRNVTRRRDSHYELDEMHHPVELLTPERVLSGREQVDLFVTTLEAMPDRTRNIFILHRFEEMSYADIADHIGISLSAVGKHMVRALRRLAEEGLP
ncbi:RNA polymerase sigma factor [Sphingopyxis sp. LARHCG72]